MKTFLFRHRELLPGWLRECTSTSAVSLRDFFSSRIVYYPGSGKDGHPVELFGSSHSAHCFVYVDYGESLMSLQKELNSSGFRGYSTLRRISVSLGDLVPYGWMPTLSRIPGRSREYPAFNGNGFLEILQRNPGFSDEHGAERLAILFLKEDGIAAYDALFCQPQSVCPPFAVLLQDHGFGMNYTSFGAGGLLDRVAQESGVLPRYLLVGRNTCPWNGFVKIDGLPPGYGGMHHSERHLYCRASEQ